MAQSENVNGVTWVVRLTDGRVAHLFLPGSPAVVFGRDFKRETGPADGSLEIVAAHATTEEDPQ